MGCWVAVNDKNVGEAQKIMLQRTFLGGIVGRLTGGLAVQFHVNPLSNHEWTVVARSRELERWDWEAGYSPALMSSAGVVTMQKAVEGGFCLVARLYDENWRKIERWFKANPLPKRLVKAY